MSHRDSPQFYVTTPTLESDPLSKRTGLRVFMKLENVQTTGSFKIRGISHLIKKAVFERGCKRLFCASGGNAGIAAAYTARELKIPCTVVLPETSAAFLRDNLRAMGADVVVAGTTLDCAIKYALESVSNSKLRAEFISSFEHPDIWEGHESMMIEVATQISEKPDVIIVSVGGGGLLNGVVQGLWKNGWNDVPVIAMETNGADCFNEAIKAGKPVTLPGITSVAVCLGALKVCETTFSYFKEKKHNIQSVVVEDAEAVNACFKFADDHRFLVEPACGAALAALYSDIIPKLQKEGRLGHVSSALVVVCGGSGVKLELLHKWKKQFNL